MIARNEKAVLRLVDLLYSCVDGDSSWSAFLAALGEHFGATPVGITTNATLQACVGVDPVELDKYQRYYLSINPWLSGQSYPEGKVFLNEEILPVSAYRKTAYYNEWGKKNLVTYAVGGAIRVTPSMILFFSINRGDAQGPFSEEDRETVQMLMPHIQRAANLHDRMHTVEQRAWVLDALTFPVMYVARDGAVRWMNGAAENLLRGGRGLRVRDDRLHAQLADEDAALHRMLREGPTVMLQNVMGYGGWLRITRADDGSEISLFLARPPRKLQRSIGVPEGTSGFLILVAAQAIDHNTLTSRLRKIWGLTAAESAPAVELLESDGLQSAAEKLKVSRNTVKSQLSAIFQKSGARRQSELLRRLLAMAVIGPGPG